MGFNGTRPTSPMTRTAEGGRGFRQDAYMELYRTLNTSLLTGDSFYETKNARVTRIRDLVETIADRTEGHEFLAGLAVYSRDDMHLRSSPTVLSTEMFVRKVPGANMVAKAIWHRGDEPLEGLAFLKAMGETRPKQFLRTLAEWLNELPVYNLIKYAAKGKTFSMRDALRLAHPMPKDARQSAAFKYITQGFDKLSVQELDLLPEVRKIREGDGLTWEQHISGKGSTKSNWEVAVDKMGYMALLRNLRNFVEKDVSRSTIERVAGILSDPDQVARSKQLPFRFWNAYQALKGIGGNSYAIDTFGKALRIGLGYSANNVPDMPGETLNLIDRSASMDSMLSDKNSTTTCAQIGAILSAIVSTKAQGETWVFGTAARHVKFGPGDDVITRIEKSDNGGVGHGTEIARSLETAYNSKTGNPFRRAIIYTDMQSSDDTWSAVQRIQQRNPAFSCYVIDLRGYEVACLPKRAGCYQLAGFSDKLFNWIVEEEATSSAIVEKLISLGKDVLAGRYSRRGKPVVVVEETEAESA